MTRASTAYTVGLTSASSAGTGTAALIALGTLILGAGLVRRLRASLGGHR